VATAESVASVATVINDEENVEDIVDDEGEMKKGLETLRVGSSKRRRSSRGSSARSVRHQVTYNF